MTLGLFDLDNTLIDRRVMFARWASGMLERQQIDDSGALDWLVDVDGNGYGDKNQWMPLAAERFGVAETAIAADREGHWVASLEVDASVGAALTRLSDAGWVLGMITNGPPSQWDKIDASGLAEHFDAVVVSGLVGTHKPEPEIFRLAAELCGHPLDGWMVGDHPHFDIEGGRLVGLSGAWMRGPDPWPADLAPPTLSIATIAEFVDQVLV